MKDAFGLVANVCSRTFVSIREGLVRQARDKIASYRINLVELRLALGGLMLCCAALVWGSLPNQMAVLLFGKEKARGMKRETKQQNKLGKRKRASSNYLSLTASFMQNGCRKAVSMGSGSRPADMPEPSSTLA